MVSKYILRNSKNLSKSAIRERNGGEDAKKNHSVYRRLTIYLPYKLPY